MKHLVLFSTVLALGAASADTAATSPDATADSNVFAVQDVSLAKNQTSHILAVPFAGYGDNQPIKVSEIIKTANLAEGDKLYAVNSGTTYDSWTLTHDTNKQYYYWAPDKQVTVAANGEITATETQSSDTVTLTPGSAFWLVRKSAASGTTAILMGQALSSALTKAVSSSGSMSWNLVGATRERTLANVCSSPSAGDLITLANGTQYKYTRSGCWKMVTDGVATGDSCDSDTLPAGTGFWYTTQGTTEKTLSL